MIIKIYIIFLLMLSIIYIFIIFLLIISIIYLELNTRYYNPKIGNFMTADTATHGEGFDLQGLNRYSFCNNNPIKHLDHTGNKPINHLDTDVTYVKTELLKLNQLD